jgi:hypothetical protein
MNKYQQAISYFEDAVKESDEIIAECSSDLQAELTEQKNHFIVALEVMRANRWIPVSERLPEYGDTVLAFIKHNYNDDGWRAYRVYEYTDHWVTMGNLCEVIAWRPLPEPPKEVSK